MPFAQTDLMSSAYLTRMNLDRRFDEREDFWSLPRLHRRGVPLVDSLLVLKFGVFVGGNGVTHLNRVAFFIMDGVIVISVALSHISKIIYIMISTNIVRRRRPPSFEKQGV